MSENFPDAVNAYPLSQALVPLGAESEVGIVPSVVGEYEKLVAPEAEAAFDTYLAKTDGEEGTERQIDELEADLNKYSQEMVRELQAYNNPPAELVQKYDSVRHDLRARVTVLSAQKKFEDAQKIARASNNRTILLDAESQAAEPLTRAMMESAQDTVVPVGMFISDQVFHGLIDRSKPPVALVGRQTSLEIPVNKIVSADGFTSWAEGRPSGVTKDGAKSSREVMEDYASRETSIPPLADVTALLLSDGRVLFSAQNAHRVGAARLRGQGTIQVQEIRILEAVPEATALIDRYINENLLRSKLPKP